MRCFEQAAIDRGDRSRAIGCHGQTVRHRPREFDGTGYTVQLNAPALLAELTGIDVVADFRSRDVAAGGQGAPLVPAFHRAMFGRAGDAIAVLNLGGIANLTVLDADGATIGFDCGPANALLDLWCAAATGPPFDAAGAWAATGQVDAAAARRRCSSEPYFALPPPKSTGRDLFNAAWLERRLVASAGAPAPARRRHPGHAGRADGRESAPTRCASHGAAASELIVCGGGACNADLMARLVAGSRRDTVVTSDAARPAGRSGRGGGLRLAGPRVRAPRARQHRIGHRRGGAARPRRAVPGRAEPPQRT